MASNKENAEDSVKVDASVNEVQPADEAEKNEISAEWYMLKVQVNREDRVAKDLQRRVDLAGLNDCFEKILVPTEIRKERSEKTGRLHEVKRKKFPGYLMVRLILTDKAWFLLRETPGIGDFTGGYDSAHKPLPMRQADVDRMLGVGEDESAKVRIDFPFKIGDRVKIKEGTFEGVEGRVSKIDIIAGKLTVDVVLFNTNTPVELEYWQVEEVEV